MIPNDRMQDFCHECANGDQDAAAFLLTIARITRLADDFADGEPHLSAVADMSDLLLSALVYLPNNAFYQRHQQAFSGVFVTTVLSWAKSEDWRYREPEKTRMFAFVMREATDQIAWLTAFITGGQEHAMCIADKLHEIAHLEGNFETFGDWEKET